MNQPNDGREPNWLWLLAEAGLGQILIDLGDWF